MRITIARGELAGALSVVGRGLSSRSTLPILSGVLASAKDGVLTLQATDLEVSVRCSVAANVETEGSVVFPGRLTADIVKSLPEAAVTLQSEADHLSITAGQSAFSVKTLQADDFPKFPEVNVADTVNVPAKTLAMVVRQVSRAVSRDETRPILTGVYLTVEDGSLRMVATDSYRLAVREVPLDGPPQTLDVVVPGRVLDDVSKMAPEDSGVSVGVSDNQIVFEFGSTVFVSRRIEGNFPNYKQLIPKDAQTTATLPRAELLEAVKRVALLAQHNTPLRVRIAPEEQTLSVSANTADVGEAREDLMVTAEGDAVEIAFNHAFLADGISASNGETMTLSVFSPLKPGVLTAPDEEGFLYLAMPVRLG